MSLANKCPPVLAVLFSLGLLASLYGEESPKREEKKAQNPGEIPLSTINVIQRARGVFVYTYREIMDPIDPLKDFTSKRRITDEDIIDRLKKILADNADYKQQYTARCMPVWDYGVEFR